MEGQPVCRTPRRRCAPGCILPAQPCRMHGARRGRWSLRGGQVGTMEVLLIDDDASLRRTMRTALETMGHHATDARDGTQALEMLGRRPFDVALLDLRLAREQGLDLLPELLRQAPGLCVVIVTAYATIETAVEAMRRGAFDYLPKPF